MSGPVSSKDGTAQVLHGRLQRLAGDVATWWLRVANLEISLAPTPLSRLVRLFCVLLAVDGWRLVLINAVLAKGFVVGAYDRPVEMAFMGLACLSLLLFYWSFWGTDRHGRCRVTLLFALTVRLVERTATQIEATPGRLVALWKHLRRAGSRR